jgi:hypothetical protein
MSQTSVTRQDYCQFLLSTQTNYTLTYFANHHPSISHDAATRYLHHDHLEAKDIWQASQHELVLSPNGYLIFDDSVINKNHSRKIEMVRAQYSGNEGRVIRGIGVINCLYYNPELDEFWLIDYRIFDPAKDGKDKHEHVMDMLEQCLWRCSAEQLEVRGVLMDTWYATKALMLKIHRSGLVFYCPVKGNRKGSVVKGNQKYHYQALETLVFDEVELDLGQVVHLNEFPCDVNVKLFRIALSTEGTSFIVTNDEDSLDGEAVKLKHHYRWKVEQLHREEKQLTGIEACQCRGRRAQRNHLACAMLVW